MKVRVLWAVWTLTATSGTRPALLSGSQQFLARLMCTIALPFRFAVTVPRMSLADEVTLSPMVAGVYAGPGSFREDRIVCRALADRLRAPGRRLTPLHGEEPEVVLECRPWPRWGCRGARTRRLPGTLGPEPREAAKERRSLDVERYPG